MKRLITAGALCAIGCGTLHAENTIDPGQANAYGANMGWINHDAPDGLEVTETYLRGYAYSGNFGWIHYGDQPQNGHTYSNANAQDYGVNLDESLNLSGYAYCPNIGWINFSWASASDPNRPKINTDGNITGYAYSANFGWIFLGDESTPLLVTQHINAPDTDLDNIADSWEWRVFKNLHQADATSNHDLDPSTDLEEYQAGTDPFDANDHFEVIKWLHNETFTNIQVLVSSKPNRLYRINTSSNLADFEAGTWATGEAGDTWLTFQTENPSLPLFFTVKTQRVLAPDN